MGVTNTPSPGTDGAVCEMCDGEGQCIVATDGLKDSCPTCGGTGRAKADCAPVAADLPAGALAAQIESAAESWATVPDRYKGEPSKRDATEVRRFTGVYGFHFDPVVGAMPFDVVDASDHTAAIQASLAREAALEAKVHEYETEIAEDIEAFKERDRVLENAANTMTEMRIERDALRSRLAAVEAERDALRSELVVVAGQRDYAVKSNGVNHDCLNAAHAQLALQAKKVGRMREALGGVTTWLRAAMNYPNWAWDGDQWDAAKECVTAADAALKDA